MKVRSGEQVRDVRLENGAALLDGERLEYRIVPEGAAGELLDLGGQSHRIRIARKGDRAFVWCDGDVYEFLREPASGRVGVERGDLLAPMPGRIRKALVSEGDTVAKGQVLLILEAMKMEHAIRAPRDGVVRRLPHREGDLVETGTALVELGSEDAPVP